jgi:galactokinase
MANPATSFSLMKSAEFISNAPGRVNLLGEHVDYNGGAVLPMAIDRYVHIEAKPITEPVFQIEARDLKRSSEFSLTSLAEKRDLQGIDLPSWALYPAGVAWALHGQGLEVRGLEAVFSSQVPVGAGLSSSAAVEVGFGKLWQAMAGFDLSPLELAKICQRAENRYVGVNCGLMDQFASACGVAGGAVWFDTRTHENKPVKLPENTVVVVADTGVRRGLAGSAYNDRRASCEEALSHFQKHIPGIQSLREVSIADFEKYSAGIPEEPLKRSRYIVRECARMDQALEVLARGDAAEFGNLMNQTHIGLRDDYGVSCPELDAMAETAWTLPGCFGSRLTGAGFGGCTVSLVQRENVEGFEAALKKGYLQRTGNNAEVYICEAVGGAAASRI